MICSRPYICSFITFMAFLAFVILTGAAVKFVTSRVVYIFSFNTEHVIILTYVFYKNVHNLSQLSIFFPTVHNYSSYHYLKKKLKLSCMCQCLDLIFIVFVSRALMYLIGSSGLDDDPNPYGDLPSQRDTDIEEIYGRLGLSASVTTSVLILPAHVTPPFTPCIVVTHRYTAMSEAEHRCDVMTNTRLISLHATRVTSQLHTLVHYCQSLYIRCVVIITSNHCYSVL